MTKPVRDYTAKAAAIVNAGAAIKSRIKEANEDLARAYEVAEEAIKSYYLNIDYDARHADQKKTDLYYTFPALHNFKEKHVDLIRAAYGDTFDADIIPQLQNLVALRAEVKAVEVVKMERKDNTEEKIKERALKSFEEWMKDRKETFDWTKAIMSAFNEEVELADDVELKGVRINQVFCQNYAGTRWIRIDWFMMGRKVPFQIIMGAAEAVRDEKKK